MSLMPKVTIYDTTLRDGTQGEGFNLSVHDKFKIAEQLDSIGIHYIEGGWPGSNDKDVEFFRLAKAKTWRNARLAAFGSTRRASTPVQNDPQVRLLIDAETPVITIYGKTWILHVTEVLRTTPEENLSMIHDTVAYLASHGREVIYDAEHAFDGFKADPDYARACWKTAANAGAAYIVLCDTNGGSLPHEISAITAEAIKAVPNTRIGIHTHNDSGLGVANALASVAAGASQVQGTINGYGERTGNCNLTTVVPNLQLKMGIEVISKESLARWRDLSHFVDEVANQRPDHRAPYVGMSAFAHKGGTHVNAINKLSRSYEHIAPELVGNRQRILVNELSGRTNIFMKAREMGIILEEKSDQTHDLLRKIKQLEHAGYEFEAADASLELLIRRTLGQCKPLFELLDYHVSIRNSLRHAYALAEATVKIRVQETSAYTVAEAQGPVAALDLALRQALCSFYPKISEIHLTDYKVRIIDSARATAARTRVLLESCWGDRSWTTVGVSESIIEASWLALVDSLEYGYFLIQSQ
jgi:2-isopropylmalate synthase